MTDALAEDGNKWSDTSDSNCADYRSNSRCANDAVIHQNFQGYGAETNCCGCGRPLDASKTALAYIDVDPAKNYATWVVGGWEYKTSYSKLRFDEATQLVYTADCKC